jgi:hypothetical protein
MENSSSGLSDRGSVLGYLLAAVAGIVASAFVPMTAPVIGMMFVTFGISAYRSRELPRLATLTLIVSGVGIVMLVFYTELFLTRMN